MKRRNFLKAAGAASGVFILRPSIVFGSANNSAVNIGMVGCGNRGSAVISTMSANNNINIIALADIFPDKLSVAENHVNTLNAKKGFGAVPKKNIYQGSKSYQSLINNKDVDAVLISTPGYAHPFILDAAVKTGKHVYSEKPTAVDTEGCKRFITVGNNLGSKQTAVVGFQIRYATPYVQMVERIRKGDIGDIVSAQLYYFSSVNPVFRNEKMSRDEMRIRNHFYFNELSGGIYLDQAIHMIDVCNWALGATPLYAMGLGGDKGKSDIGNAWTNYQVIYKYPKDINVTVQSSKIGKTFGDVCARFIGTKGIAEAHYSGGVFINGESAWDSGINRSGTALTPEQIAKGTSNSSLDDANIYKGRSFINAITSGNHLNLLEDGANSTLSAILGREAAEKKKIVYWKDLLARNEKINPALNLKQFDN